VKISPRYEGPTVLDVDAVLRDPSPPLVRQRARFADELRDLDDEAWHAPTRCDAWSVQDVVEHLVGTNRFWTLSVESGLRGEPTQLLASFDPVAVPAAMVDAARGRPSRETLADLDATNEQFAASLSGLDDRQWSARAEAPPGHVSLRSLALHAIWDSWVHERDVLLPLGREPRVEADEVLASLAYVVALGPVFRATTGATRRATLRVRAHDPAIELTVVIGPEVIVQPGATRDATATIDGDAVDLVEGLSFRAPMPSIADEHRWMVTGLDEVFEVAG